MVCEICKKNEAKVHLSNIEGGEVQKIDLCEACAKAKGVDDTATYSLANLLLGLGVATETPEPAAAGTDLRCSSCGFTQADFKKLGRLGCPECYATFDEPLRGLLKTMHKGSRHVGKVPRGAVTTPGLLDKLKGLQKKLDKAVATEDFEAAATLRDEMKQLKDNPGKAPAE